YEKNFVGAHESQVIGEGSTLYFYDPESAELINNNIPSARIIIILRNPVDRVYSNYWQYIKSGFALPPFDELIRQEDEQLKHMVRISNYPEHVGRFLRLFGDDRVMVLDYQALRTRPVEILADILQF